MISISKIDKFLDDDELRHRRNEHIKQAFRYYDEHSTILDYLQNCSHVEKSDNNSMDRRKIEFFDPNKNLLLQTEFEVLGRVYTKIKDGVPVYNFWVWSWADEISSARESYMSKKLQDFFATNEFGDMTYFYKNIFNKPVTEITEVTHLEVIISLSVMAMKNPYILPVNRSGSVNGYAIIEYLLLVSYDDLITFTEKIKNK